MLNKISEENKVYLLQTNKDQQHSSVYKQSEDKFMSHF
jgi:hypothetical protein